MKAKLEYKEFNLLKDANEHVENLNIKGFENSLIESANGVFTVFWAASLSVIERNLDFVIHLEGGLIQRIFCNDKSDIRSIFKVIDYDTEGIDENETSIITHPNGKEKDVYISYQVASLNPHLNNNEG